MEQCVACKKTVEAEDKALEYNPVLSMGAHVVRTDGKQTDRVYVSGIDGKYK